MSIYLTMTLNNIDAYNSLNNIIITNNNYNYVCAVGNLDYLQNKRNFNKYLNKFLDKCQHYEIKIYNKIDHKYHIFEKKHIVEQINDAKKHIINNHITHLQNMMNNKTFGGESYIAMNNKIIPITHKMLLDLDKLIKLTDDIYSYNLLCMEDLFNETKNMYVDVSEINDDINTASQYGYIDEYK